MLSTEKEIFDKLNALHTDVQVTKKDVTYIRENIEELKDSNKTQQEQIDNLVRWRAGLTGAWGVVSAVVVYLATHIFRGIG